MYHKFGITAVWFLIFLKNKKPIPTFTILLTYVLLIPPWHKLTLISHRKGHLNQYLPTMKVLLRLIKYYHALEGH